MTDVLLLSRGNRKGTFHVYLDWKWLLYTWISSVLRLWMTRENHLERCTNNQDGLESKTSSSLARGVSVYTSAVDEMNLCKVSHCQDLRGSWVSVRLMFCSHSRFTVKFSLLSTECPAAESSCCYCSKQALIRTKKSSEDVSEGFLTYEIPPFLFCPSGPFLHVVLNVLNLVWWFVH